MHLGMELGCFLDGLVIIVRFSCQSNDESFSSYIWSLNLQLSASYVSRVDSFLGGFCLACWCSRKESYEVGLESPRCGTYTFMLVMILWMATWTFRALGFVASSIVDSGRQNGFLWWFVVLGELILNNICCGSLFTIAIKALQWDIRRLRSKKIDYGKRFNYLARDARELFRSIGCKVLKWSVYARSLCDSYEDELSVEQI